MIIKYIILIKGKNNIYYKGESDGYYKASNQHQIMGGYNAWKGELGCRAFAPSGLSVYDFTTNRNNSMGLTLRSLPEIICGILERQQHGFIEKGEVVIKELENGK